MNTVRVFDVATPGVIIGMLAGGIIVLILIILLIALVEAVIFTIIGWAEFRKTLGVSVLMNSISGIIGGVLLVMFPQPTIEGISVAMLLSILIESGIMIAFRVNSVRLTLVAVILANLISYAVIIFPAFFYAQS